MSRALDPVTYSIVCDFAVVDWPKLCRHNADEPWGAYLQGEGNPAINQSNPQAQTTWVPVDWQSW